MEVNFPEWKKISFRYKGFYRASREDTEKIKYTKENKRVSIKFG